MNWDLKALFKDERECENSAQNLAIECENFSAKFKGKLSNLSGDEFLGALKELENLSENIEKIATYAYLNFATNSKNGGFLAKFEKICNDLQSNLLFFEIEFCALPAQTAQNLIAFAPKYEYYLNLVLKSASHKLNLNEELVLLKSSNVGVRAFARLFDETMARMKFKFDGKNLNEEQILSLLHDKSRKVRKKATEILGKTLNKNAHILTYIFNMVKTDAQNECELRHYEAPEFAMHEANQITKNTIDALINATQNSFDLPIKFYKQKRKILGFKKLYDYDRYAPLSDDEKIEFSEAKRIVLDAFGEFDPRFRDIATRAFDEGWIDAFSSENKISGAFSHSAVKSAHPYVMLNFTQNRRDLFTFAHELGHAIHQFLSYEAGFFYQNTPLTTAETASVFCEMIVFDYVLKRAKTADKSALIAAKLEDIFATLYRQISFTTFERRFHAQNGEISHEQLSQIWLEESRKMFGDALVLTKNYAPFWSYIPHFIHTPFYCYSYGFAQLFVLAIFGIYKHKKCENFTQIYTQFLRAGGSKSPNELISLFGLDLDSDEFWQLGLDEIRALVDEFCAINSGKFVNENSENKIANLCQMSGKIEGKK